MALANESFRTDRTDLGQADCVICGRAFYEDELVYRNGKLVCTVRGTWNKEPCFDERGVREVVRTSPYIHPKVPDSGPFKVDPGS